MALIYQTEYHLGPRGRVTRTYGGLRALIAIGLDLALATVFAVVGLVFALVGGVLRLAWRIVQVAALAIQELVRIVGRFLVDVITLPRRVARHLATPRTGKPVLASFDEL
jgi:cytochrome c biogenesis protein CcdA